MALFAKGLEIDADAHCQFREQILLLRHSIRFPLFLA